MKPEAVSPARPPEHAHPQRAQGTKPDDTPADLFATLLFTADQGLAGSPPPLGEAEADPRQTLDTAAWLATSSLPAEPPSDADPAWNELAALGVGAEPPSDETAVAATAHRHASSGHDAQPVGQWVSTVAKARPKTPPQQLLTQPTPASAEAAGQNPPQTELSTWHMHKAAQAGSLPTDTWGSPEELELATGGASSAAERSGEQREPNQGQRGEAGRVILDAPGASRHTQDAPAGRSFAAVLGQTLGHAMDDAFEQLGTQVSLWAAGNAKKASLRLEAGLREALDVEVSLQGDKAHLAFRTDDAQVRDALRAQAQEVLAQMLARTGIALEGLSVGSQDRDHAQQPGTGGRSPRNSNPDPESPAAPAAVPLGRITGAGLSVYA